MERQKFGTLPDPGRQNNACSLPRNGAFVKSHASSDDVGKKRAAPPDVGDAGPMLLFDDKLRESKRQRPSSESGKQSIAGKRTVGACQKCRAKHIKVRASDESLRGEGVD